MTGQQVGEENSAIVQHKSLRGARTARVLLFLVLLGGGFMETMEIARAQYIPSTPKPPQLAAAKSVFISNNFGATYADSDRMYDEVYSAVQHMNRFSIVTDPSSCDLILEFRFGNAFTGPGLVFLNVVDPKSHVVLWSVSGEGTPKGLSFAHVHKNEPDVIDKLMDYLKIITAPK
ncbi:hypothetical protein [Granulicella aggregans]|uniref:hypothetical protein n=1 Tax=Granulicella aggregans TaxID=474949 RepID=UPI0021DFADCD|nr:hypothetical protein [Granulicella aggregans]